MKTIYIVIGEWDYSTGFDLVGAFSSLEKAESARKKAQDFELISNRPGADNCRYDIRSFDITE